MTTLGILNYRTFVSLITAFLLSVTTQASGARSQELEPSDDLFSSVAAPDPYEFVLRSSLLGQHRYRKCQVVAIPSFQREWAVYLVRDEDTQPQLVFKRVRKHLWAEMMRVISDGGKKGSYSIGRESQDAALKGLKVDVDTSTATITPETADLLEEVWSKMLERVHYSGYGSGLDGTTYHVSHWYQGAGFRSGRTWSPEDGSRPAALVNLSREMCELTEKPNPRWEAQIRSDAQALLKLLK